MTEHGASLHETDESTRNSKDDMCFIWAVGIQRRPETGNAENWEGFRKRTDMIQVML